MRKLKSITIIGLTLFILSGCKKNDDLTGNKLDTPHENYITAVEKNISSLSPERKKKRAEWIADLKKNPIYISLVDSNTVSIEYLPTINAISEAIKNSYIENGSSVFGISEEIDSSIIKSNDGAAKMDFVVKVALLSLKMNGGMPKEIVAVFDNYRKKFNLYGKQGDLIIVPGGERIKIENNYNLSYAFALFDPADKKVLDAIFESVDQGISDWNEESNVIYDNGFMALKNDYMKHLKEFYADSPYLLNVDFEIIAAVLYAGYRNNEVAADEKFKGKKLAITGTISDIGKDIADQPYISFRVDDFESVTCYFDNENVKAISKLSKGEKITVVGKCGGLILTNVVIRDCQLN